MEKRLTQKSIYNTSNTETVLCVAMVTTTGCLIKQKFYHP